MKIKNYLWLYAAAVFILTFTVFSFSLSGEFLDWDDSLNFVLNENYRGLAWENLKWMFTTFHMNHYQPLAWLTLGIDYCLWGMNPFGYHLTAIILHSFNSVLFFLLCLVFFKSMPSDAGSHGLFPNNNSENMMLWPAFMAAVFFAWHPLRAESVSWITERRDLLCGFFYLSSLLAYFKYAAFEKEYAEQTGKALPENTGNKMFIISLLLFLCGLFSKSMAIILPPVLVLLDFYPLRRFCYEKHGSIKESFISFLKNNRKIILEKIPFFLLAFIFGLIAYFGAGKSAGQPSYYEPSILKGIYAYGFYVLKTILPLGLIPVYPMPERWAVPIIFSSVFFIAATWGAWQLRKKQPVFLFALAYYIITLFPVCGILNGAPQPASDRYTYLPMLSIAILFGYLCGNADALFKNKEKFFNFPKFLVRALFMSVPFLFAGLSFFQQKIWADSEALWLHALEYNKKCDIAWNNLANAQYKNRNFGAALLYLGKALELKPDDSSYLCNAGKIHLAMGNKKSALSFFERAMKLDSSRYDACYEAGRIYLDEGDSKKAENLFLRSIEIRRNSAKALYALGRLLVDERRYEEAAAVSEQLLALLPDNSEAITLRAYALAGKGRNDEALALCDKALLISPENNEALALRSHLK